jgi:hypothetical protein
MHNKNIRDVLGVSLDICSIHDAERCHQNLVDYNEKQLNYTHMPYYRGEGNFGWDISPQYF